MSVNSVCISGHLGADPEVRETQTGTKVMNFRMAVNKRKRDQGGEWYDYANWVGVVVFGNRVDWLSKELRKGKLVHVQGELSYQQFEKDGQKRSSLEVIANEVDFERPPRQQGQRHGGSYAAPSPTTDARFDQSPMPQQPTDPYDSDIPF